MVDLKIDIRTKEMLKITLCKGASLYNLFAQASAHIVLGQERYGILASIPLLNNACA